MSNFHLFILVHGLWGTSSHFDYIESQLLQLNDNQKDPNREKIVVYKSTTNEGYRTYDGIDLCGNRVATEIVKFVDDFQHEVDSQKGKITKVSVIGYSLGGLIARYVIGILYFKNFFKLYDIKPVNFLTFCTPHVGVLTPGNSLSIQIFNYLVPKLLANSGKQMFLKDKISSTDSLNNISKTMPLLELMASPNSIFFKALSLFAKRSLYSNVINDKRTSFWTSGISMINPFEILDLNPSLKINNKGYIEFDTNDNDPESNSKKFIKLHFIKNYEPIILDVNKPIKISGVIDFNNDTNSKLNNIVNEDMPDDNLNNNSNAMSPSTQFTTTEHILDFLNRKFKWLKVLFKFVIYLPSWVIWFILHNVFQASSSSLRTLRETKAYNLKELTSGLYKEEVEKNETNGEAELLSNELGESPTDSLRPPLARTFSGLSETYEDTKKNFEDNLHDQGDRFLESVWDAMTSKPLQDTPVNILQQSSALDENLITRETDLDSIISLDTPQNDKTPTLVISLNEISTFSFNLSASSTSPSPTPSLSRSPSESVSIPASELQDEYTPLLAQTSFETVNESDKYKLLEPFKLDLSPKQQTIIHNLNKLNWFKYPIYITKTKQTHAASIVRHLDETGAFDEGKVVVRHSIDEVLLL